MKKNKNYKYPIESEIIKTEVICPNGTIPMGILKNGRSVEKMDIAAAVCVQTHVDNIYVTTSINTGDFNTAAKVDDIIISKDSITKSFNTSMEIYVQLLEKNVIARNKCLSSEAYFTFGAFDENRKTTPVMAIKPLTASEKVQFDTALVR